MGTKTKIDWCDATWNPVTGCLHGCDYCYARRIAERFRPEYVSGMYGTNESEVSSRTNYELKEPMRRCRYESDGVKLLYEKTAYPFGFVPTFHRYRLEEPQRWKKPRNIFVCSMADLFGDWVPDAWIREVFEACKTAPQHRYLFLTKNPARYMELAANGVITKDHSNFWFGSTATTPETPFFWHNVNWIIVGAETGNRKNKVVPRKTWVNEIARIAKKAGTPVFMKESLRDLMGDDFRQEFPWEV